jgi:FAD-linked oxidoreductase
VTPTVSLRSMATWTNWSRLATSHPAQELTPHDAGEVVDAVRDARRRQLTVKMPGTGHSFTDIAVTDGVLLRPGSLRGIMAVDLDAMTVTALAGTPLGELNVALARLGLSLHNMGDIQEQTLAGAISTGTHGTGGVVSSISAQVSGLELVTGDGEMICANAVENSDVLDVARVGLGALGIITSVTLRVEPMFVLEAHDGPMSWDRAVAEFDALAAENHYFELYWFPHTDRVLAKRNNRTLDQAKPLSRSRAWFDDEFLSNRVFGWVNALGNLSPRLVPRINAVSARALGERRYSDEAYKVFTSPRRVVFREMEYAVPREAGLSALRDVRALLDRSRWRISFPVEVRLCPADDVPLSPGYGRDSVYLAFHTNVGTDHRDYFRGVEDVLRGHGGRPHWAKLHTMTAADLAADYPRWEDFQAMRDRLDPGRIFTNPYLARVLGP